MDLLNVAALAVLVFVGADRPPEASPHAAILVDGNCTRAGQAIGVQDQCDVYSALLDTYMDKALAGDPRAAFMVGLVYMDDDAFTTRSIEWFKRSADGGHKNGQYYLGLAYELGEGGVDQDPVAAHAWFQLAADQGLSVAKSARDRLSADMSGAEIADAEELAVSLRSKTKVQ